MDSPSNPFYICYAVGIFLLFVAGIALQGLNLYSLFHRENRQKELTPYLLSIAMANFVFLVCSYPSTFLSAINYRWIFGEWFCVAEGFLAGTSAICMLCQLSVIVVKTSNAITKVSHINRIAKKYRSYKKEIAFTWLFSMGVMLPPTMGLTSMSLEGGGTNCAPNWKPTNSRDIIYAITLTLVAFVIPVAISMVFLAKINRSLSRHREICKKSIFAVKSRIVDYGNVSKMVGASIFIYVLLWTPYSVGVLVSVLSGNDRLLDGDISLFPTLIAKSSAVFSPVVYFTFNLRFRRIVLKLFKCKIRRQSSRVKPLTKTTLETTIEKTNNSAPLPEEKRVKPFYNLTTKTKSNIKYINEIEEVSIASSTISNRYTERRGALKNPWI